MIITIDILKQKVPKEIIPTRLDSVLNLYTNIKTKTESGILVYNTNPDTWNCLYPFYEINHKFTLNDYKIENENPTYEELIKEYQKIYKKVYEEQQGFTKETRINILKEEYKNTFNLSDVTINDSLTSFYELKYSKSQKVWTLYYFENYIASKIENINDLYNQKLYEQKVLPLSSNINSIDGVELVSNLPFLLSIESNVEKLNNNIINLNEDGD